MENSAGRTWHRRGAADGAGDVCHIEREIQSHRRRN